MSKPDITSCRALIDSLGAQDLLRVDKEVSPILEATGILKAMENGPTLLYEKVTGFPGQRMLCNMFAREDRVAAMFGASTTRELKHIGAAALRNPIAPRPVSDAPSQEVVITKDIDVLSTLPVCKYTETAPAASWVAASRCSVVRISAPARPTSGSISAARTGAAWRSFPAATWSTG